MNDKVNPKYKFVKAVCIVIIIIQLIAIYLKIKS